MAMRPARHHKNNDKLPVTKDGKSKVALKNIFIKKSNESAYNS
jgi:hypothetical protein